MVLQVVGSVEVKDVKHRGFAGVCCSEYAKGAQTKGAQRVTQPNVGGLANSTSSQALSHSCS